MSVSSESQDVSVIGLGDMGSALAEALLASGHRVTVWNRTASKCEPLAETGACVAVSVREAAAAQTLVVCVLDHVASASLLQSDEVARALRGKLLVQLSTVTAEESRALGHWAEEHGIEYLDGSILGYREDVLRNGCPIVYSGSKTVFEANEAVLAAMGGIPRLVSETIGGAPTFDKTVYSFHYGSILAFFHGAAMCHAAGFPVDVYAELVLGEAGENTKGVQRRYGEMIASRSYGSGSIELNAAAYAHVIRLSEEFGIDDGFPRTVAGYFERAIKEGRGEQELAAVFEVLLNKSA